MTERKGDLAAYVTVQTGAPVTHEDIAQILGVSRGTYVNRRRSNKVTADDVIQVARHYGFNEVQAIMDLGYIEPEATAEFVEAMPGFTSVAIRSRPRTRIRKRHKLNPDVSL